MTRIFSGRGDVVAAVLANLPTSFRTGTLGPARAEHLHPAMLDAAESLKAAPRRAIVKTAVRALANVLGLAVAVYLNDPDQLQP